MSYKNSNKIKEILFPHYNLFFSLKTYIIARDERYAFAMFPQRSVIVRVNAKWRENYHMVFHYVLNGSENAHGEVLVRRVGSNQGVTQRGKVTFKPTKENGDASNRFVVVGENGTSTQFAMLDGLYDIQFTTDSNKLLLVGI